MAKNKGQHRGKAPDKVCFVIGPIGDEKTDTRRHADWLLEGIIEPVFAEHFPTYLVQRSDKISSPGSISSQIINLLHTAELVIADMSLENANAFYEMGIRHMKRLPTIHMYSEGQNIPFDVKPYRAIPWKYAEPKDLKVAQAALKAAIDEVIKPGFEVVNPVTQAKGFEKLEETATPEQRVLFDQIQQLQRRLDNIENANRAAVRQGRMEYVDTDTGSPLSKLMGLSGHMFVDVSLKPGVDPKEMIATILELLPYATVAHDGRSSDLSLRFDPNLGKQAVDTLRNVSGVKSVALVRR